MNAGVEITQESALGQHIGAPKAGRKKKQGPCEDPSFGFHGFDFILSSSLNMRFADTLSRKLSPSSKGLKAGNSTWRSADSSPTSAQCSVACEGGDFKSSIRWPTPTGPPMLPSPLASTSWTSTEGSTIRRSDSSGTTS